MNTGIRQKIEVILLGFLFCIGLLEIGIRIGAFTILLDREYENRISLNKAGVYRILCLGESTTAEGRRCSWPSQLEKILNKNNLGVKVKVINKGLEDINTSDILLRLQGNLEKYKPHMVITMMGVNDRGVLYYRGIVNSKFWSLKRFKSLKFLMLLWRDLFEKIRGKERAKFANRDLKESSMKRFYKKKKGDEIDEIMYKSKMYKTEGNLIKTEEVLEDRIKKYSSYIPFYTYLGDTYVEQGKYKEAEYILRKVLKLSPDNSEAYGTLGFCYLLQRRFEKAEAVLKRAIEIDPMNKNAYDKLIECYTQTGKSEDLDNLFKRMDKMIDKDDVFYGFMATHYIRQKNIKKAEKYYKKANEFRLKYYNPMTRDNYRKLKEILDQRGIRLVCVQYPVRSVRPLKKLFDSSEGIIFVDNEKIFKDVLKKVDMKIILKILLLVILGIVNSKAIYYWQKILRG